MSVAIAGIGLVTPLGVSLDEIWTGLMEGKRGHEVELRLPDQARVYSCLGVDDTPLRSLGRTPRLRRSSAISYFTAAAGLAALTDAGLSPEAVRGRRLALIFAVASGGVIYTRKFYDKIAREGAGGASPLLFPETVYNAPASHLSSVLGIDGATYSLVGDATAGIEALALGRQLLESDQADLCLVVSGEELDWILCEAYRQWRLLDLSGKGAVHTATPRGMRMSEGGAAVLLAREGRCPIVSMTEGVPFFRREEMADALREAVAAQAPADVVIGSANGTFIDRAEREALEDRKDGTIFAPKAILGESLGSGAITQVACAVEALKRQQLPGTPGAGAWAALNRESRDCGLNSALVTVAGLNHQVAALTIGRHG